MDSTEHDRRVFRGVAMIGDKYLCVKRMLPYIDGTAVEPPEIWTVQSVHDTGVYMRCGDKYRLVGWHYLGTCFEALS